MSNIAPLTPQSSAATTGQRINALVPTSITDALQLADIMAKASLIPSHLQNKPGDCLLIVMQAQRWGMDAVSVAQCTSVVKGKLCYEGKLVAAALYATGAIDGRLRYDFSGSGDGRRVVVTGRPRGTTVDQTVEGTVGDWKTDNGNWKKSPDDMLVYRGTRQWARRYAPEALLGVYTPDELEEIPNDPRVVGTVPEGQAKTDKPAELPLYTEQAFAENLPKWWGLIASGKKSADDLIATLQTKARFTPEQLNEIRNPPKDEETGDQGDGA
jgi:hypothetical protein